MEASVPSNGAYDVRDLHSCQHCSQIFVQKGRNSWIEIKRRASSDKKCRFTYSEVAQASCDRCPLFEKRLARLQKFKDIESFSADQLPSCFSLVLYIVLDEKHFSSLDCDYFTSLDCEWQKDEEENEYYEFEPDPLHFLGIESNTRPEFQHVAKPLNLDPGSPETFQLIRTWANRCWTEHRRCIKTRKKLWSLRKRSRGLPTRLLDIGSTGEANVILRDIVDASKVARLPREYLFAVLSYCWGSPNANVRLLKANMEEFRRGIALANLPATIQDAIYVVRAMGLQYIWIDALCIIQDDRDDQERELQKMEAIFAGAQVVLSAAVADSCHKGFLQPRNLRELLGNVYRFPCYSSVDGSHEGAYVFSEGAISDCQQKDPIDKRAWTLQERAQAVSLLRFGTRQVSWKCQMSSDPEIDGGHNDRLTTTESDEEIFVGNYHQGSLTKYLSIGSIYDNFCEHWRNLIVSYTTRSLTLQSDALPAIGALAENYALTVRGEMGRYCAGLWEQDMARQLLWFKPSPTDEPENKRRSPSWSWASLPGQIQYPAMQFSETNIEIINCAIKQQDLSWPYRGVISGVLTVKAQLRALPWAIYPSVSTDHETADDDMLLAVNVSWDTRAQWRPQPIFCMEILPDEDKNSRSLGLVLRPLENSSFERIGYYECPGSLIEEFDKAHTRNRSLYRAFREITII